MENESLHIAPGPIIKNNGIFSFFGQENALITIIVAIKSNNSRDEETPSFNALNSKIPISKVIGLLVKKVVKQSEIAPKTPKIINKSLFFLKKMHQF